MIPPGARQTAEQTLTADGTVTRGNGDIYDPETGSITPGAPDVIWSGCCSLSPATGHDRTLTAGDDRLLDALVCRLPVDADSCSTDQGDPAAIKTGDLLTVAGVPFVVKAVLDRTSMVLRRLLVIEAVDAQGVPR